MILAKAIANEPAASCISPRRPRKSMEMMEREYRMRPVRAMGKARLKSDFASLMISEIEGNMYSVSVSTCIDLGRDRRSK